MSLKEQDFLQSFSRRVGKSMNQEKKDLLETLLPKLEVNPDEFLDYKKIILDIGFGTGDSLINLSKSNPDALIIGCEVFVNGVASALYEIQQNDLKNIRIFTDDVRILLDKFLQNCLDEIYILFPDPWPKTKHNKRRLISEATLDVLHNCLKNNGNISVATDHNDYFVWCLSVIFTQDKFKLKNNFTLKNHPQTQPELFEFLKQKYSIEGDYNKAEKANYKLNNNIEQPFLTPYTNYAETKYNRIATKQGRVAKFIGLEKL